MAEILQHSPRNHISIRDTCNARGAVEIGCVPWKQRPLRYQSGLPALGKREAAETNHETSANRRQSSEREGHRSPVRHAAIFVLPILSYRFILITRTCFDVSTNDLLISQELRTVLRVHVPCRLSSGIVLSLLAAFRFSTVRSSSAHKLQLALALVLT